MGQNESNWCRGCEKDRPLGEFYKYPSGEPLLDCKACVKEYQRKWRAERKKKRVITAENRDFFQLGATAKDDQIRDLQKALDIAQRTIRALVDVIKEANLRDHKSGRIPA